MLHTPAFKSHNVCMYPLTLSSLAVCRHAELGCTARLREVSGLSQAVALTRPSVVWLNLQSNLRENCPPWIDITYPGPDIPTQQAVGMPIAVLKWWTALIIRKSGKCRERNRSVLYQVHTG